MSIEHFGPIHHEYFYTLDIEGSAKVFVLRKVKKICSRYLRSEIKNSIRKTLIRNNQSKKMGLAWLKFVVAPL